MKELTEAQIDVAVKWWSEAIAKPKFDNGDNSQQGAMAMIMATLAQSGTPEDSDKGAAFAKHLRNLLSNGLQGWCLAVDYHPEGELAEAAKLAGLDVGNLAAWPWKTTMWFEKGGVQVRAGYGAPQQTLLEATAD